MKLSGIIIFLALISSNICSQQKKIYLAPDDHTDYLWSATEDQYKHAFLETLDYYIRLNDSTAKEPYQYQSKWNCDGSLWVYTYEKNRSKEQFSQLIRQIKEEKITVPLNTIASVMGIAPLEATIRDMYYAGSLERKFGINLELVINMEDQVLPLGLSSVWAGAGAKYSWRGVCACATKVSGLDNRQHEIYWYKGIDDQKVLMKWYSVNPSMIKNRKEYRYYLGTYLEASDQLNAIIDCKALMNQTERYPYRISAAFGKGGDDLKTLTDNFPKIAKAGSDADYQVIVSNEIDFFRDFEKEYGSVLPSETVSYGSTEWGNSAASLAEVSATVKRSIEKLRAAEALFTIVALKDKKFATGLNDKRQKAWIACGLYFEHDWTADGRWITRKQRADWQRKIAGQLKSYVDTLYDMSVTRLGELISSGDKNMKTFFVFNPLSWSRTDVCDYLYNGPSDIVVTDKTTSGEVPCQIISKNNLKYLRILAANVPSLGYRVFEIKKGVSHSSPGKAATAGYGLIENDFYKISFTPEGVITSLIDKHDNNRECIKAINNLYANDLGSGINTSATGDMPLRIENNGPVSVTLVAESYKPVKHTSRLTLFKNIDRIEIENYITQNFDAKPLVYAFSYNLKDPETWHEEAGAILNAKPQSQGGHYSDSICRVDWLAINHFADMSDGNNGMILSNRDALFMKTGNSTLTTLDCHTPQISVLAGGQIDAPALGIVNQDGDSYFENFFAMKPCRNGFNAATAMKFALEHQNPLVAGKITSPSPSSSNTYGTSYSLLTVSEPDIFVWSVKPAEEGINNGIILRVWNMANENKKCSFSLANPISKCIETTHIETDRAEILPELGLLNTTIGHNKIQTYRLFTDNDKRK